MVEHRHPPPRPSRHVVASLGRFGGLAVWFWWLGHWWFGGFGGYGGLGGGWLENVEEDRDIIFTEYYVFL